MKVIVNRFIPFRGFVAVTLWPFVFCRRKLDARTENHELIHGVQQRELLLLFFYLWYIIEFLVRLVLYRDFREAYRNISFEQEAYIYECCGYYLYGRRCYAWLSYLTKKSYRRR